MSNATREEPFALFGRGGSMRGFSLLEVVVALALLTSAALLLVGAIAASQKVTSHTRERQIAYQAIRTYIEEMRAVSLTALLIDTRTPADFLPAGAPMTNATGRVSRVDYESGAGCVRVSGTQGSANTTTRLTSGFANGTLLAFPRDLTGNNNSTENPASVTALMTLPAEISLTWTGAGGQLTATAYVCFGKP